MAELLAFPASSAAPSDTEARERALDTTQSFLVEAPAGSGKTGLLIQRYLKLLAGADVASPAQVLAITFTRKATGEMRERVLEQLHAAAGSEPMPAADFAQTSRRLAQAVLARDRELGWYLLEQPGRLNISSIDALCGELAAARPVLTGGGALRPAETEEVVPLLAEAARRTLALLGGDDPELSAAIEALLLHRDGNLDEVSRQIAAMLGGREQWMGLLPDRGFAPAGPGAPGRLDDATLEREVLPRLERALDEAICRALTRATRALPLTVLERLCKLAAEMGTADGYGSNASPIAICSGKTQAPGETAAHLNHWRALIHLVIARSKRDWRAGFNSNQINFMINPGQKQQLKELIDELRADERLRDILCEVNCLPSAVYPHEQWVLAKALFRVLGRALAELQTVFEERGVCDFGEQLRRAQAALRGRAADAGSTDDLPSSGGLPLRHLLVDEMQDTSSGQYELVELLTAGWGPAGGQTVFLVGDPKQSIYLFRQARVERFVRTLATGRLGKGELRLETLQLRANFRSSPELVADFNRDFGRIFPAEADPARPEEVAFYPASAGRPDAGEPGTARLWHTELLPAAKGDEGRQQQRAARAREAAEICRIVVDWQGRPLPAGRLQPWRVAVLARGREHLQATIRALRAAGLPFRAVKIEALGERQEVLDLLALTRALLHPADRTVWLALLRAPWCGLTLADLHKAAGGDDPAWSRRTVLASLRAHREQLSEDGRERLDGFLAVMVPACEHPGVATLSARVERTWRELNAAACSSPDELANAERFFELLDAFERPGGGAAGLDLRTLETRLAGLYAAPRLGPVAVELMTLHGAKGLEWDAVIVPGLERCTRASSRRLLDSLELDPEGDPLGDAPLSIFAPIKSKGGAGQELNDWMASIVKSREKAERKRLLYVACTRAREELHLFAALTLNREGAASAPSGSLLDSAWPAASAIFAEHNGQTTQAPAPQLAVLDLAASADPVQTAAAEAPVRAVRVIRRFPARTPAPAERSARTAEGFPSPRLAVLEGSFAARVLGNTLHSFLEELTRRLAAGTPADELLRELPTWAARARAVLRAGGTGTSGLSAAGAQVLLGLRTTLLDPDGLWLLQPHAEAASERGIVTAADDAQGHRTLRLDRTFLAGPQPRAEGSTHRWIVDFKTGTHGREGLARWLAGQRELYAPQLERYAAALRSPDDAAPLQLGLYFPLLGRLVHWTASPAGNAG